MENTMKEMTIVPITGQVVSETTLGLDVPYIEAEEVFDNENHPNFIESNTQAITFEELTSKNIIPTFGDNTLTISHQSFIGAVTKVAEGILGELKPVECRVSHPIIGRIPSAQHKKANELREDEKTIFYQRMAFVAHVKNLTRTINGQTVHLVVGECRGYNEDKLYNKASAMKFRIFVGWQVRVCSNLCLTCDGYSGIIDCMTEADIMQKSFELFSSFNPNKENTLQLLENLHSTKISEEQFCKIKLENMQEPLVENGFGLLWHGCLVTILGGNWNDIYCRGKIIDFNLDDGILSIETETAWGEMDEVRHFIEKVYPALKFYYYEEECGCEIYQTNDRHGHFFSSRYIFDDQDGEGMEYFDKPETLLAFASRAIGKKLQTIEDLNDAVDDSEGFSFHEIKVVND